MTSLELLVCAVLIFFSGCLSASEVALFSLSRFQLRSLKENFNPTYKKIKKLLSDPGGLLITILVTNEVLNISISTLITKVISRAQHPILTSGGRGSLPMGFPPWLLETLADILVTTPLVLFFCEITPKVAGIKINQIIAPLTVNLVSSIYRMSRPIRITAKVIVDLFLRFQLFRKAGHPNPNHHRRKIHHESLNKLETDKENPKKDQKHPILRESEFMLILEESRKEGAIEEKELELIKNVLELDNMTVGEISTPLPQTLTLPVSTTLGEALSQLIGQRYQYSRTPIVKTSNKKEIVGILHSKDLLRSKLLPKGGSDTVGSVMRKPLFVPSSMKLSSLFRKLKETRLHMAVVKNPAGECVGIITMDDILKILFEDFFALDEESEKPITEELNDRNYPTESPKRNTK